MRNLAFLLRQRPHRGVGKVKPLLVVQLPPCSPLADAVGEPPPATVTHAASHSPLGDASNERAQPSHARSAAAERRAAGSGGARS